MVLIEYEYVFPNGVFEDVEYEKDPAYAELGKKEKIRGRTEGFQGEIAGFYLCGNLRSVYKISKYTLFNDKVYKMTVINPVDDGSGLVVDDPRTDL
jgi:hypothetical protein